MLGIWSPHISDKQCASLKGEPRAPALGHEKKGEYLSVAHTLDSLLNSWAHRVICLFHLQDACSSYAEHLCILQQIEVACLPEGSGATRYDADIKRVRNALFCPGAAPGEVPQVSA